MTAAQLSLIALAAALAVSMTSRINVGWLAIALAWLIGVYRAGMAPEAVMAGFPVTLFLTLAGVTLLFAIAETNHTLSALAVRIIGVCGSNRRVIPIVLFAIACGLSSVGPGAISAVALVAPIAMRMGDRLGVPTLLTALMVTNGANAGNLSPFSSVGIIANGAMARAGLGGHEARVWFANFAAHVLVAGVAYVWLVRSQGVKAPRTDPQAPTGLHCNGGHEAGGPGHTAPQDPNAMAPIAAVQREARLSGADILTRSQRVTLLVIAVWIAGVLLFGLSLGLSAFAAAAILILARAADERAAVRALPWGVIMMVTGVSVLIGVLEKTGGMDLFTALLARAASPNTINGVIAFVTGAISTYSSTSGVVLPAFLPTVPGLIERLGGGDPLAVALSINVGASLVDVSPLSTLGALCVAAAPMRDAHSLFRALLVWGVAMTVVGAIFCQLFVGPLL